MLNKIESWSYEKPIEEGYYLVCFGDVETPLNVSAVYLGLDCTNTLCCYIDSSKRDWLSIFEFSYSHSANKFAKLVFSPSEIEEAEANGDL